MEGNDRNGQDRTTFPREWRVEGRDVRPNETHHLLNSRGEPPRCKGSDGFSNIKKASRGRCKRDSLKRLYGREERGKDSERLPPKERTSRAPGHLHSKKSISELK